MMVLLRQALRGIMGPLQQNLWPLAMIIAMLSACSAEPDTLELTGYTMGTGYSVRVVRPDDPTALDTLAAHIAERLEALDNRFSTYREMSEVSRFNAHAGDAWFEISPDLLDVLMRGIAISELSDGAFDMTVGPLVELWGFGASDAPEAVPPQGRIDALLRGTGSEYLEVRSSPPAIRRTRDGVSLDLSAIAKGFAVDEISELLDAAGLTAYMVEIGGEVRTRGGRADGGDWVIGIENPLIGTTADAIQDTVRLRDAAIATSGDYRNYFEHEGNRYSHTLDPRTGWPVSHGLTAVSVIAERATDADALATALMVMGPELGLQLATRERIAARLMVRDGDELEVLQTPDYGAYLDTR